MSQPTIAEKVIVCPPNHGKSVGGTENQIILTTTETDVGGHQTQAENPSATGSADHAYYVVVQDEDQESGVEYVALGGEGDGGVEGAVGGAGTETIVLTEEQLASLTNGDPDNQAIQLLNMAASTEGGAQQIFAQNADGSYEIVELVGDGTGVGGGGGAVIVGDGELVAASTASGGEIHRQPQQQQARFQIVEQQDDGSGGDGGVLTTGQMNQHHYIHSNSGATDGSEGDQMHQVIQLGEPIPQGMKMRRNRVFGTCRCSECGQTFVNSARLERHMAVHSVFGTFMCTLCGKTYKYEYNLFYHWRRTCRDLNELMNIEDRKAMDVNSLRQLVDEVAAKKAELGPLEQRVKHMAPTLPPPPREKLPQARRGEACPQCGVVVLASHLKRHLAIHRGDAEVDSRGVSGGFYCDLCGLMFRQHFNLIKHWRTSCPEIQQHINPDMDLTMDDDTLKGLVEDLLQKKREDEEGILKERKERELKQQQQIQLQQQQIHQEQSQGNVDGGHNSSSSKTLIVGNSQSQSSSSSSVVVDENEADQQQSSSADGVSGGVGPAPLSPKQNMAGEELLVAPGLIEQHQIIVGTEQEVDVTTVQTSSSARSRQQQQQRQQGQHQNLDDESGWPPELGGPAAAVGGNGGEIDDDGTTKVYEEYYDEQGNPITALSTTGGGAGDGSQQQMTTISSHHGELMDVSGEDGVVDDDGLGPLGFPNHATSRAKWSMVGGPVQCPECFRSFANAGRLERHLAGFHASYGTHHCTLCGNRFKYDYNLLYHYRRSCPYTKAFIDRDVREQMDAPSLRKLVRSLAQKEVKLNAKVEPPPRLGDRVPPKPRLAMSYPSNQPPTHLMLPRPGLPEGKTCPVCGIIFYSYGAIQRHMTATHPREWEEWEAVGGPEACDIQYQDEEGNQIHLEEAVDGVMAEDMIVAEEGGVLLEQVDPQTPQTSSADPGQSHDRNSSSPATIVTRKRGLSSTFNNTGPQRSTKSRIIDPGLESSVATFLSEMKYEQTPTGSSNEIGSPQIIPRTSGPLLRGKGRIDGGGSSNNNHQIILAAAATDDEEKMLDEEVESATAISSHQQPIQHQPHHHASVLTAEFEEDLLDVTSDAGGVGVGMQAETSSGKKLKRGSGAPGRNGSNRMNTVLPSGTASRGAAGGRSHHRAAAAATPICQVCDKRFITNAHLKRHMKTHSVEGTEMGPVKCKLCEMKFPEHFSLITHWSSSSCASLRKAINNKSVVRSLDEAALQQLVDSIADNMEIVIETVDVADESVTTAAAAGGEGDNEHGGMLVTAAMRDDEVVAGEAGDHQIGISTDDHLEGVHETDLGIPSSPHQLHQSSTSAATTTLDPQHHQPPPEHAIISTAGLNNNESQSSTSTEQLVTQQSHQQSAGSSIISNNQQQQTPTRRSQRRKQLIAEDVE